ncbi:phage portal protein [Providencia rettgeri]
MTFKIPEHMIDESPQPRTHEPYKPIQGVVPNTEAGKLALAMDATPYDVLNSTLSVDSNASVFLGFPVLATLAQQTEYYNMAQVVADEMVRNWITIKSSDEAQDKVELIEKALVKYDIKRLIHEAVKQDAIFGVGHIFVGIDDQDVSLPLILDKRAIPVGAKLKFKVIDPVFTYPAFYNATDPLDGNFYKPESWFVMGKKVHESRLIDIVSRPVPDMLKPSYNFAGLSLTQLMMPYVDDWTKMRQNVIKIVRTLRMRALKTELESMLQDKKEFEKRMKLFVQTQDNFGIWAMNAGEEFIHQQTSLSDLSNLLSNYQEQLCIPARITNLKLLGNAPAGLNASGQSELDTWHETVSGMQERDIRRALETLINIIQLVEIGEIDSSITFDFNPLDEVTDKEAADIVKVQVETIAIASDSQIISTDEARLALANIDGLEFIKDMSEEEFNEWQESQNDLE